MGTNFYWRTAPCPTCGHIVEQLHIGKSSAGWCFALRVAGNDRDKERGYPSDLDGWRVLWQQPGSSIVNEYGDRVTPEQMDEWITQRGRDLPVPGDFDFGGNHGTPGPNNLIRRRIGDLCTGHGEGTWDLMGKEFS